MVGEVLAEFPDFSSTALMHYCNILVESIKMKDFEIMKKMVGVYKAELQRDASFIEYQDRIAKYYFNGKIKAPNMMQ